MGKKSLLCWSLLLLSICFLFILDFCFYLFDMYDQDCKAVFVIQRCYGFIVMNAFGFVFFLSSFLAFFCCLIVTPRSLFFFFFIFLLLSGSNYAEILCCVDIVRIYFPHGLFHTFTH